MHADNPGIKIINFPPRSFWAEQIPSEKDIIYYLNITKWFEDPRRINQTIF